MAKILKRDVTPGYSYIEEYVTRAQFTDGGSTTGTYQMKVVLPIGAHVLATTYTQITGFTGDTSATLVVGDGADADRYNTSTPSVYTTAGAVEAGIPSGIKGHAAAVYPTLTVTSAADFTNVTAGAVKVTIFFVKG